MIIRYVCTPLNRCSLNKGNRASIIFYKSGNTPGGITQEKYDSLLAIFKRKQSDILLQMEQHNRANENYYLEASRLLELSTKAHGLFESSNVDLKRKLLTFILQNSKMDGKKLIPELKMPFDVILQANKTQDWLPRMGRFSNF